MITDIKELTEEFKSIATELEASIKEKCPKLSRDERLLIMAMSFWTGARQLAADAATANEIVADVTVHLIAATSLLDTCHERLPPSKRDALFKTKRADYERSISKGRAHMLKVKK